VGAGSKLASWLGWKVQSVRGGSLLHVASIQAAVPGISESGRLSSEVGLSVGAWVEVEPEPEPFSSD
jgi:hypothetical protein